MVRQFNWLPCHGRAASSCAGGKEIDSLLCRPLATVTCVSPCVRAGVQLVHQRQGAAVEAHGGGDVRGGDEVRAGGRRRRAGRSWGKP